MKKEHKVRINVMQKKKNNNKKKQELYILL